MTGKRGVVAARRRVATAVALHARLCGGWWVGAGSAEEEAAVGGRERERQFEFFDFFSRGCLLDAFASKFGPCLFRPNVERREARYGRYFLLFIFLLDVCPCVATEVCWDEHQHISDQILYFLGV
jgi:hypothetical protein